MLTITPAPMRRTSPSSVFPHFPDKNLLPIGYQDEVSIHAIDTTRGPGRSVIPPCLLRPPQGGFYIEGIPSQPASSPPAYSIPTPMLSCLCCT